MLFEFELSKLESQPKFIKRWGTRTIAGHSGQRGELVKLSKSCKGQAATFCPVGPMR